MKLNIDWLGLMKAIVKAAKAALRGLAGEARINRREADTTAEDFARLQRQAFRECVRQNLWRTASLL